MENNEEQEVTPEESNEDLPENSEETDERDIKIKELESQLGSTKRDLKDTQKKLEESSKPKETSEKTDEPDYSKIALLNSVQVIHADDQKIVMDEAARLKLPLTDVLQMEHVKAKLGANKTERDNKSNTPNGSGRGGQGERDNLEYLDKNPQEFAKADLETQNKVIDAKIKRHKSANTFADEMYVE